MAIEQGYQAETFVDEFEGQKAVIKRVKRRNAPLVSSLSVWMLKREGEILQRLSPVEGIPDFLGHPDDESIAMEFVEGRNLREVDREDELPDLPASFFDELLETARDVHACGVVHSDLKKKENIMVTPNQRPVIIDFGSAFRKKSSWRFVNNFFYEQFKVIDQHAVLKIKYLSRPDLLREEERDELMDLNLFEKVSRWGRWALPFRENPPPLTQRYD